MKFEIQSAKSTDANELTALINSAYRGESGKIGWTTESDLLGGQRTSAPQLLEAIGDAGSTILIARAATGEILGCVLVKALSETTSYLGMLTVDVKLQKAGVGRELVDAVERFSRETLKTKLVEMTVIAQRDELIAWYERRGYKKTGERREFPYGDERFGIPLRPDLYFEVLAKQI